MKCDASFLSLIDMFFTAVDFRTGLRFPRGACGASSASLRGLHYALPPAGVFALYSNQQLKCLLMEIKKFICHKKLPLLTEVQDVRLQRGDSDIHETPQGVARGGSQAPSRGKRTPGT